MFTWYSILLSGRPCIFSDTERQRGSDRETYTERQRDSEREKLFTLSHILYSGRQICIRPYIFSHTEHKEAETERQRVIERERNCLPCIAYFTVVDRLAFVLTLLPWNLYPSPCQSAGTNGLYDEQLSCINGLNKAVHF